VLSGVRCSRPAGGRWELGNSNPFCAFKEGAESDVEQRRGSWERREMQPEGSEL